MSGIILILLGIPFTLIYILWPITGNHGATWLQFLPLILISSGVVVLGIFLIKYENPSKNKNINVKNEE